MYKTILVLLDGAEETETILAHVESMAGWYDASVILLIVATIPILLGRDEVIDLPANQSKSRLQMKQYEAYLAPLHEKLASKGIRTTTKIRNGPIVGTILDVVEQEHVDLMALTSRSFVGLSKTFPGSTTSDVLQSAHCPLFIVQSEKEATHRKDKGDEKLPNGIEVSIDS